MLLKTQKSRRIASAWHGGQWSSFYQYASSGVFVIENTLLYIKECLDNLQAGEFAAIPYELKKKDRKELEYLLKYFLNEAKKNGIEVIEGKHSFYGYTVYTCNDTRVIQPQYAI
jgi:aromatic ring hydroxylase